MVLPVKAFHIPILPAKWTQLDKAIADLRAYTLLQFADEQTLIAEKESRSGTLICILVRASDEVYQVGKATQIEKLKAPEEASGLESLSTADEKLGNIFV